MIVFSCSVRTKDPEEAGRIPAKRKSRGRRADYSQEDKRFAACFGRGPDILEVANRGASEAGGPYVHLNTILPFE